MKWTNEQIDLHLEAANRLDLIKNRAFTYIQSTAQVTEFDVQQFILSQFIKERIVNTVDQPIVGFGASAAEPHYFPQSKHSMKLLPNQLILIDLWGKLKRQNAPYADITWMGYYGKNSNPELKHKCDIVFAARDKALDYIRHELKRGVMATGQAVNQTANDYLIKHGFAQQIKHSTGHSIGTTHVHGIHRNVNKKNQHPLITNLGYTIEPGIYMAEEYGIRSEMNFYINDNYKLIITTPLQKELIMLSV